MLKQIYGVSSRNWTGQEPGDETSKNCTFFSAKQVRDRWEFSQLTKDDLRIDPEAVLFIHGFNNKPGDVLAEVADLRERHHVQVIPFIWNSKGELTGYEHDREQARASIFALAEAIEGLMLSGVRKISLVAHSMGNFIIKEFIEQLPEKRALFSRFCNIGLVEADVANKDHKEWGQYLKPQAGGSTYVTINAADYALEGSTILHEKGRLGDSETGLDCENFKYLILTGAVEFSHNPLDSTEARVETLFTRMFRGKDATEGLYPSEIGARVFTVIAPFSLFTLLEQCYQGLLDLCARIVSILRGIWGCDLNPI